MSLLRPLSFLSAPGIVPATPSALLGLLQEGRPRSQALLKEKQAQVLEIPNQVVADETAKAIGEMIQEFAGSYGTAQVQPYLIWRYENPNPGQPLPDPDFEHRNVMFLKATFSEVGGAQGWWAVFIGCSTQTNDGIVVPSYKVRGILLYIPPHVPAIALKFLVERPLPLRPLNTFEWEFTPEVLRLTYEFA